MINNLKIIEDDDTHIYGFSFQNKRYSKTLKRLECLGYLCGYMIYTRLKITRVIMWPNKWSYEKEIECEERCERIFKWRF